MHLDREQLVFQIFSAAFEQSIAERSAFLTEACGNDEALRLRIERLLATADTMGPHGTWETELEANIQQQAASLIGSNRPPNPQAGDTIGDYVVTAQLGAGSMGSVFAATDPQLHRSVAIKVISTELLDRDQPIERMRREALLVAALNHPHIVTLYGLAAWRGQPCLVMEHLSGQTLDAHLANEPLPPKRFFQLAI